MPDSQAKVPLYNLENTIRSLGSQENSYTIGILDCCREPYHESKFIPVEMRSGIGNEEKKEEVKEGRNVFLIFGCPP